MFAISSNLVDGDALNILSVYMFFGHNWTDVNSFKGIPLPTQECSAHRIAVLSEGLAAEDQSVIVSGLHTSRLFQVCFRWPPSRTFTQNKISMGTETASQSIFKKPTRWFEV